MRRLFSLIILFLSISLIGSWRVTAQETETLDLDRIRRATVFVIQAGDSDLDTLCVGTGTIVRFDGLILTNAHQVTPGDACPGDELIIAIALNPDDPPVPKYRAEIVQVDIGLDLALLRITRELDGRVIEAGTLPILPFVELADSDAVQLDETLTIIGYPDLGNNASVSIQSTAIGFMAEPSGGEKSWIKLLSAELIPGLISGGGAYNQQGQLVGVPTTAPITVGDIGANCLLLEDSNSDGFINNNDTCVPVGDFISVVRPANFAEPLIRSASLGLQVETLTAALGQITLGDASTVDRLYLATSVTNNLPTRVIGSVPAGTTSLYLFFDFFNFTPETVYEVRVSVDGVPSQTFSLPPVRWSGGTNGLWFVGGSGQPWPNGNYEFRVLVNGLVAASRTITIGGIAVEEPLFSNLVFGLLDQANNLQGESFVLPTGDLASARFIYRNMQAGTPWTAVWYYNSVPFLRTDDIWKESDGVNGARDDVIIRPEGGLRPGNYRVDLFVGDPPRLSATGDFVVAGAPEAVLPDVFRGITFYRAENAFASPSTNAANNYPDGAHTIYARFDWQRIARGTLWTMQWLVDDTIFYEETSAWNTDETGQGFAVRLTTPNGLPDGTYTMNLLINGILLQTASVSVGIGQLEINRLDRAGGVQLRGQIVDADTRTGIEGATFVLISKNYSIADFAWDAAQVYALAVTDKNGRFELDRPLALDAPYSVYILAEGYLPIATDGYLIDTENLAEAGGSPIEMYIPLTKD
jgi:hypothetical protein